MADNTNINWKTLGERDARREIGPRFTGRMLNHLPDPVKKGIPIYLKAYYEAKILNKLQGKSHE